MSNRGKMSNARLLRGFVPTHLLQKLSAKFRYLPLLTSWLTLYFTLIMSSLSETSLLLLLIVNWVAHFFAQGGDTGNYFRRKGGVQSTSKELSLKGGVQGFFFSPRGGHMKISTHETHETFFLFPCVGVCRYFF